MNKPIILITNDDGIKAKGLRYLISIMKEFGNILVVASEKSHSGQSHAITSSFPLRLKKIEELKDYTEYMCNGTPADCIKLGVQVILKNKPDLIVSGINHGSNASVNIVYSGTMAAVIEGCIAGIPSIGFSLNTHDSNADFNACGDAVKEICTKILKNGLTKGTCLNVNIPSVRKDEIKGIKVCRQANARWIEEFVHRSDPRNHDYYWLTGHLKKLEESEDTDQWALENNYISVVPAQYDLTSHQALEYIKSWNLNGYGL